jgi:5-dehydro-2-deoxygluconokinase
MPGRAASSLAYGGHNLATAKMPESNRMSGKIEGLDRPRDWEEIVAVVRRNGRDKVGCIIHGRGEDDQKVSEWPMTASGVPGLIGFAVGRTSFWDGLVNWRAKKITRGRYCEFVTRSKSGGVPLERSAREDPSATATKLSNWKE